MQFFHCSVRQCSTAALGSYTVLDISKAKGNITVDLFLFLGSLNVIILLLNLFLRVLKTQVKSYLITHVKVFCFWLHFQSLYHEFNIWLNNRC